MWKTGWGKLELTEKCFIVEVVKLNESLKRNDVADVRVCKSSRTVESLQ